MAESDVSSAVTSDALDEKEQNLSSDCDNKTTSDTKDVSNDKSAISTSSDLTNDRTEPSQSDDKDEAGAREDKDGNEGSSTEAGASDGTAGAEGQSTEQSEYIPCL